MGDRCEMVLGCVYCGKKNEEVYFAPTCGFLTFECDKCGKHNYINSSLKAIEIEKATFEDVVKSFENTTNASWSKKDIHRICRDLYKVVLKCMKENETAN